MEPVFVSFVDILVTVAKLKNHGAWVWRGTCSLPVDGFNMLNNQGLNKE
jgi:hypothetical protein